MSKGLYAKAWRASGPHQNGTRTHAAENDLPVRGDSAQDILADVLESTSDAVFMLDYEWRFLYLNRHAEQLISNGRKLAGRNIWDEFPAARTGAFWANYHRTMIDRVPATFTEFYPAPVERWFEVRSFPASFGMSVFFCDVTRKRSEQEKLRLLREAIASAPMSITLARSGTEDNHPLTYVNAAFERLSGYTASECLGRDCRFLQGTDLDQEGRAELRQAIKQGRPAKVILRNYKRNGKLFINELHLSPVRNEDGMVTHIVGIQNDITEQMESKDRLAYQAQYDHLTGLANRNLLFERLDASVILATRHGRATAVVILDLDNFKHMNDRLGHMEADELLIQIAERLRAAVDPGDTVGRLGGDEFALILSNWSDEEHLRQKLETILAEVRRPLRRGPQEFIITGSAGVALLPRDTTQTDELLQLADASMYSAKRSGKNSFCFYSPQLRVNQNEPLDLAVGLRRALANHELRLFYQPRIGAASDQLTGFEALMRWQHPERGLLMPSQFIHIAEETGLIHEIGQWAIEEALRQNAAWRAAGLPPITLSVNVSAAQVRDAHFPRTVGETLARFDLPPVALELELTESLLIDEADQALERLLALKKIGVRIALDDFGSGYSGLLYLSRFPIDTLKVAHGLTGQIETDSKASAICRSAIGLGESLGLLTVAEGVETTSQADLLRSWNCTELQGYLFAKALTSEAAEAYLRSMQP